MKPELMNGAARAALVGYTPASGGIARLFAGYGPKPLLAPDSGGDPAPDPKPAPKADPAPVDDDGDDEDDDPSEGGKFTVAQMKEEMRKMRGREKRYRIERNEARAKIADLEKNIPAQIDSAKSEMLAEADKRTINAEVRAALRAEGFVDLDAMKLLDTSKLKLNDSGEVEGLDDFVKSAKKDKSYLFKPVNSSHTGTPPRPREPAEKHAKDMTEAEYNASLAALTGRRR